MLHLIVACATHNGRCVGGGGGGEVNVGQYSRHRVINIIQWNLSNPDTNGAEESAIVSEACSFQRLKCMQEWYLGSWEKVSCLERCPQFRSVLIERESISCQIKKRVAL